MLVATIIQMIFGFKDVATLGSVFGTIPRGIPEFSMPHLTFDGAVALLGPAFTIALLGAIESLLSATAADGLANTKHRPNQELIGQGLPIALVLYSVVLLQLVQLPEPQRIFAMAVIRQFRQ